MNLIKFPKKFQGTYCSNKKMLQLAMEIKTLNRLGQIQ